MTDLTSLDLVDRLKMHRLAALRACEAGNCLLDPLVADIAAAEEELLRLRALTVPGEGCEEAKDEGATFVLEELAKVLGIAQWLIHDGTETWVGDVTATLFGILQMGNVLDPETNELVATRETARANAATAERDAALARVAELGAGMHDLLSWFKDKPSPAEWRLEAGKYGADDAINQARSLLTKPTAGNQT